MGLGYALTEEFPTDEVLDSLGIDSPFGLLGLYLESKTPGFGVMGGVGVACLLVLFFGHKVAGLEAVARGDARRAVGHFTEALQLARRCLTPFEAGLLWNELAIGRTLDGDLAGAENAEGVVFPAELPPYPVFESAGPTLEPVVRGDIDPSDLGSFEGDATLSLTHFANRVGSGRIDEEEQACVGLLVVADVGDRTVDDRVAHAASQFAEHFEDASGQIRSVAVLMAAFAEGLGIIALVVALALVFVG